MDVAWAATVAKAPLSPLPFLPLLSPQSSTAAASAAAAAASAAAFSAVSASSAPVASVAGASAGNCSARGGGQNTGPVLQWPPPREARAPRPLSPPDWLLPSRQPPSQPAPAPWQPPLIAAVSGTQRALSATQSHSVGPSEALSGPSVAIRGTQRHSEALRGHQRPLRATQRHSLAFSGTQRHAEGPLATRCSPPLALCV